ncbi:MAG TPA: hypothetical protein VGP44_04535 [Gemmatimonadales bacterium]|nr:hypothetical protein [Gemmatimonadales bacterium]
MAKNAVVPVKDEKALVAQAAMGLMEDAAGMGLNFEQADLAIPFVRVAQKLSPTVNRRDAKYIEGLEVGDLYNTVTLEYWKGDEGVLFLPCHFQRSYIEWRPRPEGGLVRDYGSDRDMALAGTIKNEKGKDIKNDSKNEVITSALYHGMTIDPATGIATEVALSLSSTQLKKARDLNTKIQQFQLQNPASGKWFTPPMFARVWRITTLLEIKDQNDWMGVKFTPEALTVAMAGGEELFLRAARFHELVRGGQVRTEPLDDGLGSFDESKDTDHIL